MILHYNDLIVNVQYLTCSAPLGLLFTLYQPYIRRIDVDGTNSVTLYSSGTPFAVDYDYRCVSCLCIIMPLYTISNFDTLTGITICFGQMSMLIESGELDWTDQTQ